LAEVQGKPSASSEDIFGGISVENDRFLSGSETAPNEPQPNVTMYIPEASLDVRSKLSLKCPACGCESTFYRDGLRYAADGSSIQRWLCRACGFRFSEKPLQKTSEQPLNTSFVLPSKRQICATTKEAKNLDSASEIKTVAGEENTTQHGLIVEFQWKMKKRQLADITITNRTIMLNELVNFGADLRKPESIETILATEKISIPTKYNMVKTYRAFTQAFKIDWEPVKIRYEAKEPFDPLEEEIDLLIASCGKISGTFLQTLKDTGARCGEIRQLQWTDINEKNGTIAINNPGKGSRARTVKVTTKTLAMLKNLPKKNGDCVFSPKCVAARRGFDQTRKRVAERMQNPRLLKIHFHTLRHWRASREYEKTGDIYAVKDLLGHKSVMSTDRYQHGSYTSDDYITKRPQTSQEEDALISAGFEYVRFDDRENVPIYRKRK
jgi:integrase